MKVPESTTVLDHIALTSTSAEGQSRTALTTPGPSKVALAAMCWILAGTGGTVSAAAIARMPIPTSPSYWGEVPRHTPPAEADVQIPSTRDRVMQVKHYLSLNVSEMAKVLGVERPTVYAWLNGSSLPHASNRGRLDSLYQVASDWKRVSSVPLGKYVRERTSDGKSIVDYLTETEIDRDVIRTLFSQISERLDQERAEKRSRSIAQVGRRLGFQEVPEAIQQRSVELETGF